MKEEIIVSGRANPNIDPVLNIWHWHIPAYLFLGGLAAGLLFFSALYFLQGKDNKYFTAVKVAPVIAPIAISLGLVFLILDLKHKLFFWQLLTTVRLESPMSWGAWTLTIVTPLSIIWVATYLKEIMPDADFKNKLLKKISAWFIVLKPDQTRPNWDWRYGWLRNFEQFSQKRRVGLAWALLVLAVILGVYTGILLSAFNARPLWNTSILGPLFLVSGLSTGAATIMLMTRDHEERKMFSKIDLLLIGIELFLIIHLFMGFLASTQVQIEAAQLFLGGEYTVPFWGFVVVLGLIFPAVMEILELRGFKVPVIIPAGLILIGGLIFRFIMVEAGQVTRYLY